MPPPVDPPLPTLVPAPRAFTQGVGTIFQWIGVLLFLTMMFVCCSSSLLSKDTATRADLRQVGFHLRGDAPDHPSYSAQQAITLTVTLGIFFGIALAGLGLGLQAQNRRAPALAIVITGIAMIFWTVQALFFSLILGSIPLAFSCAVLALLFAACFAFSIAAAREMWLDPPPLSFETLPSDYKIPYSHMHQDPPDVRLAAELQQRRERLHVQQKELENLEEKIRRRMNQSEPRESTEE